MSVFSCPFCKWSMRYSNGSEYVTYHGWPRCCGYAMNWRLE